jgi:hypothetical protein
MPSVICHRHVYISLKRDLICRIEEDFKATVGERKEQFRQKLCCDILGQIQMPRRMIQDIDVSSGKIIYKLIKQFFSNINLFSKQEP